MLYSHNETLKIVLRIYEYLQMKVKKQPRTLKMDKPLHRSAVVSFLESLPSTAGADFIWNFLVFQFYVFSEQDHKQKPMLSWFMGKEAWRRWNDYSDEAKWHSRDWARENGFRNPVISQNYTHISEEVFRKEKLRMSRISGPNFCIAKFGEDSYHSDDEICFSCPFKKDCEILFSRCKDGKTLLKNILLAEKSPEEAKQLSGSNVTIRKVMRTNNYDKDD